MGDSNLTCTSGTSTAVISSDQRIACVEGGGTVNDPNAIDPDKGTGWCFVRDILTRALSERILRLGGTFQLALDFRDEILEKSPRGRRLLSLYYRHLPDMFNAVSSDAKLLFSAIDVWQSVWLFAQAMLFVKRGQGNPSDKKIKLKPADHKLSASQHRKVRDLARALGKRKPNKAFRKALLEFDQHWKLYLGVTAQEAVRILEKRK
jgi:hypothetical protein